MLQPFPVFSTVFTNYDKVRGQFDRGQLAVRYCLALSLQP